MGNCSRTALRACSSSGLEKVSSLRLVFLLLSDDPRPWDPRDPAAVEQSLCPGTFQDLAESGPLEPEAAPVSKVVTRDKRLPTICSVRVILVVWVVTVWESVWRQFSILDAVCEKSSTYVDFSSIVEERLTVLSRSGAERARRTNI